MLTLIFRQIFNIVVSVVQRFYYAGFVHCLGGCERGIVVRGNRAEHADSGRLGDFGHGEALEFSDSLAPVAVIDNFTPETLPVHEATQEKVPDNLFAVENEEREEGFVADDFREGFLVEGVGLEELEGFFGLFGEECRERGCIGGCGQAQGVLPGAFFQDSGDFFQGGPVGQRKHERIAPFDDIPEEPEPVAENVGQLVEHQSAPSSIPRRMKNPMCSRLSNSLEPWLCPANPDGLCLN